MSVCVSTGGHLFVPVTGYQFLSSWSYGAGLIPTVVRGNGTYFPLTSVRCAYCGATERDP